MFGPAGVSAAANRLGQRFALLTLLPDLMTTNLMCESKRECNKKCYFHYEQHCLKLSGEPRPKLAFDAQTEL